MNATTKLLTRKPLLQPFAYLCIVLTLLTSHPVVWARVANTKFETEQSEPQRVQQSQPELRLLTLEALGITTGDLKLEVGQIEYRTGYVKGVSLLGEYTLRFLVGNKFQLSKAVDALREVNPDAVLQIDDDGVVLTFPKPIVATVQGALQGDTLDMSKITTGPGGGTQNLFWCVVALVGLGAGAYYGMKYLCKQAGLIPTNAPPPPKTNPPPPPPPTNRPPNWTNRGPIVVTSGGFKMFNLVTESSVMPSNVHAALMAGTNPDRPLFRTDLPDGSVYGIAAFDCSDWNTLYDSTAYVDQAGTAYKRCTRTTIQSTSVLPGTTTTNSWRNLMTMYVWYNESKQCISIYDSNGVLRENINGDRGSDVQVGSFDYVITHWYNPNGSTFFRSWSGLPAAP